MNAERLMMILRAPHVSEKSTVIADKFKQFTFKVLKTATKKEIKAAVEDLFKVKVKEVSVVNMLGKKKRFKQKNGKRANWKKAYVSLHKDYDINLNLAD